MTTNTHNERISRVCEYIYQNLGEDLTLDRLSTVAALSKHHFHRVFSIYTGLSLTRFVQLARLRRASFRLAFEDSLSVIDIAFEAGFDSPEAFSRAFKRVFEQTPSQFRASPDWPLWHTKFQFNIPPAISNKGVTSMKVDIIDFAETPVALIEHHGDPEKAYDTAAKFIAWRKETGLSPIDSSQTFGIPYGNPKTADPETYRFDICGSVTAPVPENAYGVKNAVIPGGRCAVARHRGSHDHIEETLYYLYREWLPDSDESVRDYPCFFRYLNFVHQVDECDLETDVYLPLK